MGCCVSRNKTPSAQEAKAEANSYVKSAAGNSKSPPLPPLEEETVKEVLSETPTPKPSFRSVESLEIPPPSFLKIEKDKPSSPPSTPPPPPPSFPIKLEEANNMERRTSPPPDPAVAEISEISDLCSLSESVSTTTIGEGRVDDGDVRQRVDRSPVKLPRKRPVSGEITGRTERGGGKSSPARRFDQSPGRRNDNNAMKPSQVHHHHHSTRDMGGSGGGGGGGGGGYTNRRLIPGSGGGVRREPGDGSGRRSRSPATRSALGQSSSSRALRSPGRIPALGQENGRKPEEAKGVEGDRNLPMNESLENPHVSLECFIFL